MTDLEMLAAVTAHVGRLTAFNQVLEDMNHKMAWQVVECPLRFVKMELEERAKVKA